MLFRSPLFFIGAIFGGGHLRWLMDLGILFFTGAVLFQIVTLPVEFDASHRAKEQLDGLGLVAANEKAGVKSVLNAAAMTYVAAALAAVAVLLYYLSMLSNR